MGIQVHRHHRMFPGFDGFELAVTAIGIAIVLSVALAFWTATQS
jgi:hypothetical protein